MAKYMFLLAASALLPLTALAAPKGVTLSQDKSMTIYNGTHSMQRLPKWNPPAGKVKIFDTLGAGKTYNASSGWTVSNAQSETQSQQWIAFAIVPKTTVTLTEIVEAVGYVAGTESVTIALLADSNGSPGKVLEEKTAKKLETFGNCCAVAVDHVKSGIQLTAGTTYWVAAILPKKTKQATTWDAFNLSSSDTGSGNAAFYNAKGWNVTQLQYSAFAVYGE